MRILPWAPRKQRKAAIEHAREGASDARDRADEARERATQAEYIKRDIARMVADNHFVQAIHSAITGGGSPV